MKSFKENAVVRFFCCCICAVVKGLHALAPLASLLARCWVAYIFFMAGLTKTMNWQGTLALFTYEYQVPLLPPGWAAWIGTGAELVLSILLVLGLGGRLMVLVFFIYNVVAVISYPFLWTAAGSAGLHQHISWGFLLALLMTYGPGAWSLDHWIRQRFHTHFCE